ncbi:hypothetical protein [Leucobacter sp. L43]|uniref:hypothetical protein n=1 Tax=Leucobacter sp. L43 TaxID=2798040 RepID=UPI0019062519|nr:hypothetical protein [Leucobacter sp. L43]
MNTITVYTIPSCAQCMTRHKELDARGTEDVSVDLSEDSAVDPMLRKPYGYTVVDADGRTRHVFAADTPNELSLTDITERKTRRAQA